MRLIAIIGGAIALLLAAPAAAQLGNPGGRILRMKAQVGGHHLFGGPLCLGRPAERE